MFKRNKGLNVIPLKAVYLETPVPLVFPAQAMFVVPKKNFKRAVDRNKLKRRMREVYRLHKNAFYENLQLENKKMLIAFIYTGKKTEDYATIEKSLLKLLSGILKVQTRD